MQFETPYYVDDCLVELPDIAFSCCFSVWAFKDELLVTTKICSIRSKFLLVKLVHSIYMMETRPGSQPIWKTARRWTGKSQVQLEKPERVESDKTVTASEDFQENTCRHLLWETKTNFFDDTEKTKSMCFCKTLKRTRVLWPFCDRKDTTQNCRAEKQSVTKITEKTKIAKILELFIFILFYCHCSLAEPTYIVSELKCSQCVLPDHLGKGVGV